jgi:two-component system phosphate regulon sensor histidine kinase PhoR
MYLLSALFLTLIIGTLLIPIFMLVYKYRNTVNYHTETLRLIYSRFQEVNHIVIPENFEERRKLILNQIDDILHHLNSTINDLESYRMRLRQILDALPLGIIVMNDDDDISYINKRAKSIFHIEDSFFHKKLESINVPLQLIANVSTFKKEGTLNVEYTFEQNIYQMRMNNIVFKKLQTKPYILITLDDISLEKSTEKIKKDFFSYASHELKSPLTSIKGFAELIQLNMLEEKENDQALTSIIKQVDLMDTLVEDMLMLARLEIIEENTYKQVSLNDILDQVLNTLSPLIKDKNISIMTDMHIINGYLNPLDINKMFKNIIENAIKYSEPNKEIRIQLHQLNNMMTFKVVDQGSGILEHHHARIFERFYRVEKDRPTKGTGLGLAIVKHIVLKYHGTISLQSKVHIGTTIEIKIPI